MPVSGFDHVAIPTADCARMVAFYEALGFEVDARRWREENVPFFSIHFGDNKINVHAPALWQNERFTLRGPTAKPGCGDFCCGWQGGLEALHGTVDGAGAEIVEGPVERDGGRDGGRAKGTSVYTRDPDANLLEFIVYE